MTTNLQQIVAEARREFRDSDAAGDVLDWIEERIESATTRAEGDAPDAFTRLAQAAAAAGHSPYDAPRLATPTPQSGEAPNTRNVIVDFPDICNTGPVPVIQGKVTINQQTIEAIALASAPASPQGVSDAVETIKRIAAQLATDDCEGDAADLIDALHALTAAGAAPEGWVLVPKVATPEMIEAGEDAAEKWLSASVENGEPIDGSKPSAWVYAAMLAATPNPGAQHGQEGRDHG